MKTQMTEEQHASETTRLRAKVTRLRNQSKQDHLTLAEKLKLHEQRKEVQKQLDDHLHNFFDLTADDRAAKSAQYLARRVLSLDEQFSLVFGKA